MRRRVPELRRALVPALLAALGAACAWQPWVASEPPEALETRLEAMPASEPLPLNARTVGKLDCYARRCDRRFRIVVDEPGRLGVRAVPVLSGPDAQARLVLESPRGVMARAGSGRGPRDDAVLLAVGERVERGVYFVLLQGIGGPVPYELTTTWTPGGGSESGAPVSAAAPAAPPPPPEGPPPRLIRAELSRAPDARYDPAVSFGALRTFTFPAPAPSGTEAESAAALELPLDRQIRRLLAERLARKGLRQARGGEAADLRVHFARGARTRTYAPFLVYEDALLAPAGPEGAAVVDTRGSLTVELVEARSRRLAWHARTTKGLGPGVTPGERTTALLREAVAELLTGFPPE